MNNETESTQKTKKVFTKQNGKRVMALLLCLSLILGASLFLHSNDEKDNVFTVGSVGIDLIENFDTDMSGAIDGGETYIDTQPPTVEKILPGQEILKQPYVQNTGDNDAYIFITVATPTTDKGNLVADATGATKLEKTTQTLKVMAYAIQSEGYTDTQTSEAVWARYVSGSETTEIANLDYTEMYGEQVTDTEALAKRYVVFQTLTGNATDGFTTGINSASWTKLGSSWKSADGYNYSIYKLNAGKLAAGEGSKTPAIFDAVKLVDAIGESQDYVINYYVSTVNTSSSAGVGAATSTLEAPEIDGYTLYTSQSLEAGSTLTLPAADTSIAKDGSTIQWFTEEDGNGDEAYTGMTVNSDMNLFLNYKELATESETNADYSWLKFKFASDMSYATLMGADSTNAAYPTEPTTVVVPSSISVTCTEICTPSTSKTSKGETMYSHYYYIESDYTIFELKTPATYNGKTYNYSINTYESTYFPTGTFTIPVTTVYYTVGDLGKELTSVAKNVVLPDTVTTINSWRNSTSCILESINIPYNCTSLGGSTTSVGAFYGDSNLTSITIPSSVTVIGSMTFRNCGLTSITIPESITLVGHQAFQNCPLESIVWLSTAPMQQTVNDVECNALASVDVDALKFVYSNSSLFYFGLTGMPGCKLILGKGTEEADLASNAMAFYGYSSINFLGSESELCSIKIYGTNKTIGDFRDKSEYSSYVANYTLTTEDLAIINAA